MSFLYPRTIRITRPEKQKGVGAAPKYAADVPEDQTTILRGLPASIQAGKANGRGPVGLPGDTPVATWDVFIPLRAAPKPGTIIDHDVVTDDTGNRYKVKADYWDSLGYHLLTERLEA